jgi:hypothetical protein
LHGDRLHAHTEGEPARELIPVKETLFAVDGGLGPVRFVRGNGGRVVALVSLDVDDVTLARIGDADGAEP